MKTVFFLLSVCTMFVANVAHCSTSHSHDEKAVVGTYISDIFQRPDPITGLPADRSLLITIHKDGTVVSYNSQAYTTPNGDALNPFTGLQLTPALGAWKYHHHSHKTIRAVFFDYFNFTTNPLTGDCLPNPCDFQVQTTWNQGEYDRFTATIEFYDKDDGFYQDGNMSLQLKGVAHNDDPLNANNEPTVCYEVQNIHIRRVNVKSGYFTPCPAP